ncbi:urea ABC transporter permease subunit UrtB [Dongia sp.]|uniref:urea ABC transporter permease subunit UrtB n=1 Tax=Dongia sp. TaxID=1977262 RepID=UPI0035B1EC03
MRLNLHFRTALVGIFLCFCLLAPARADDIDQLVDALGVGGFKELEVTISTLAATGDPGVTSVLEALAEGDLYTRKSDGKVVKGEKTGSDYKLLNPRDGADLGMAAGGEIEKIKVNNKIRRAIRDTLGGLTLMSPDPQARRAAAETIFNSGDSTALSAVEAALTAEEDPAIKLAFEQARAAILINSEGVTPEAQLMALDIVAARGGQDSLALLNNVAARGGSLGDAAAARLAKIESDLAWWAALQNIVYGVSLGSVLLLAAIGLAITFGVMGIINMAHGEMVMLGAYTTFVTQTLVRSYAPGLSEFTLVFATPLAFLVAGSFGFAIERTVIRFLYGRPLETLLATWGLSLILQQLVRSIFGPTNREVASPAWMSGQIELGGLALTYGRFWIVIFGLTVFVALLTLLKRTPIGLQMRAVTQNRQMAASMGIRTGRVDSLTFALGSGVAGLAGVALSQIDNVSPNLGQGYIIDSFMIVIFGGVGNLWGTLVGAFTLGIVNKFLEPYAGAVLGKILVLAFIILFIQIRPRGMFALKGRAVES